MQNTRCQIRNRRCEFRFGLTLSELIVAMSMNIIVILAVGTLLAGSNRAWRNIFHSENKQLKQDALATTVAFGSMGRRSNRLGYTIYEENGGTFTPAVPVTSDPQEVVSGDAVEFRYWDVGLDCTDSSDLLNVEKTATAYALFYLEDDALKVDYGPYPPGAVPPGGGSKNASGVITEVLLAENVSTDPNSPVGAFSHTTLNGIGQGSVRMSVILTDPEDDEEISVVTATLMRNVWPR
jgi:hypothetical protein